MVSFIDDRTSHCLPYVLQHFRRHQAQHSAFSPAHHSPPLFVGLNGVQGVGKTTLVSSLLQTLSSPPHSIPTVALSIDDLYLPRCQQLALAAAHPSNRLVQHRGQPGTHDVDLGLSIFRALQDHRAVHIPAYDKAAFDGQGDRQHQDAWMQVNGPGQAPVLLVIFEGWCVGFRALDDLKLRERWQLAAREADAESRLWRYELEELAWVNEELREYDALTDFLDIFIHLDAQSLHSVYRWRLEQEAQLRVSRGTGMIDEQVTAFVDSYMPAYELYLPSLRLAGLDSLNNLDGLSVDVDSHAHAPVHASVHASVQASDVVDDRDRDRDKPVKKRPMLRLLVGPERQVVQVASSK